jgi:hypothetical protein
LTASPSIVGSDAACGDCAALLRGDFASFTARTFRELNPRSPFVTNWHVELISAKLAAVREGRLGALLRQRPLEGRQYC